MDGYTKPRREKIYVRVDASCDRTGYVQPTAITWEDGRVFRIERVQDFRPAERVGNSRGGDCYTVIIGGQRKQLFYEAPRMPIPGSHGRWFVETMPAEAEK